MLKKYRIYRMNPKSEAPRGKPRGICIGERKGIQGRAFYLAHLCLSILQTLKKGMMSPMKTSIMLLLIFVVSFFACAQKRPVLYPNTHLQHVGNEQAQADIDECMRFAEDQGVKDSSGEKVAKETAKGAAVGGTVGAGVGAVVGGTGRKAAAGAAGGGAGGFTRGVFDSGDPDPVFARFVEKCLRDKGYAPVGWK